MTDKNGFTNGFCQTVCHAGCCGPMVFDLETLKKHKDLIPEECSMMTMPDGKILLSTFDEQCVFRGEDYKCKIYEDRPEICREYGTGKHPMLRCPYLKRNGTKRKAAETKKIQDEVNKKCKQLASISAALESKS